VASLARGFGGEVSVDTAVGKGSTFQVVLPLDDAGPEAEEAVAGDAGVH
jgi:signal transduction histidine kinase